MTDQPPLPPIQLVLERINPAVDMARFYVLAIEPPLFGDIALRRDWGRIGCPGRTRRELFDNHTEATVALETWLMRKLRRGYQAR